MCVRHALQGSTHFLKVQSVKWYTNNKGVATFVKSGSNKVYLHKLAMEIFSLSKEHDIAIDMEWIPRWSPLFGLPRFFVHILFRETVYLRALL